MKRTIVMLLIALLPVASSSAAADDQRDQLKQLTAQLQQTPGDQALREKIIALALTLNPRPATPDAATMAEGAAEYAFKNAKTISDYSDAAKQYEKALLQAPWLADDYFNCGVAHEKANENKDAIRNFNLYLLAAPSADDAVAVKKRIGGLQYAAQKAEDEANSPEAKLEKFIKGLDGRVWRIARSAHVNSDGGRVVDPPSTLGHEYIAASGHTISHVDIIRHPPGEPNIVLYLADYDPNHPPDWTATLTGRKFSQPRPPGWEQGSHNEFTISDDGQTISQEWVDYYPNGNVMSGAQTFTRIR